MRSFKSVIFNRGNPRVPWASAKGSVARQWKNKK